jgi:hypothetical protein
MPLCFQQDCLANFLKLIVKNKKMKERKFNALLLRIGCALSKLRTDKGYSTIKAFACKYELPAIQYWRIENGKTNLTLKTLIGVLAIHQISVEEFFNLMRTHC